LATNLTHKNTVLGAGLVLTLVVYLALWDSERHCLQSVFEQTTESYALTLAGLLSRN